ncbi:hypothetical protein MMC07_006157 [Pseudocyphellaria aurata]|nr:hypothetical protein [Pseudocyphellaria aurata]
MVYQGKPSTGTKRACPGYVQYFDLVFRDQTQSVQRKVENRRLKAIKNQNLEAFVKTQGPASGTLTVRAQSRQLQTCPVIPRALEEPPERDAICKFFTEFVFQTNNPDAQCEFFEYLLPLYTSARHDSILSLAASAVALAVSGGDPRLRPRFQMGRVINGIALKKIALAIQDPIQSVQDETLMAALLLGFFDRIHNSALGIECKGAHEAGAVALVKHREKYNYRSELSTKLLFVVYSQVVDTAFQLHGDNEKHSSELTDLVLNLPQNTANRLTVISARAAELRGIAKTVLCSRSMLATANEIYRILNIALEIDAQFNSWAESVPEEWAWYPASGFDCPAGKPREHFVYEDRIDFYGEPNIAKAWNSYRSRRMMILFTILDCIFQLETSCDDDLSYHATDSVKVMRELVDDVCASVPYLFGTKTFGGTGDRTGVEYPYYGARKLSAEHRRAAASLGAWSLIEPLRTSLSAVGLPKNQKEWMTRQLIRISIAYNVKGPAIGIQGQEIQSDEPC